MSPAGRAHGQRLLPRHAARAVNEALSDTRVVIINGARQSGKSTLARIVAADRPTEWRTLDSATIRQAAMADPTGFVAGHEGLMVIDEIQRAPELMLAIKEQVDADPRPGRFLVTGSARILGLRGLPDALPGRTQTIELWPFSQGEIDGSPDGFVDAVFAAGPSVSHASDLGRADYAGRVVRGGFPEAVGRESDRRREAFFDAYAADLIARDVKQLSEIERTEQMRSLLGLVAARSAQLLVGNSLAAAAGLPAQTAHRYLGLLEEVFLIKRVPAWSRNLSSRAVGTPKVAFVDSGMAANVLGATARSLVRPSGQFGPLLEGFVLMELARQLTWAQERVRLFHYRTKDKLEVDAVLENRQGMVVGVEVKAASTVRPEDFRGLRHLADRVGPDFLAGIVLYTGTQTLPFGPVMRAVPVSALWQLKP